MLPSAVKVATRAPLARSQTFNVASWEAGFGGAVVFQWINPKSWLICASAAGAFLH